MGITKEEEEKQKDMAMNGVESACVYVPSSFNHNIGSASPVCVDACTCVIYETVSKGGSCLSETMTQCALN